MKRSTVFVPWEDGLKFRSAARIIKVARSFHSSVVLRCEDRIGDVRSILSMVSLCASLGAAITVEVCGEDEVRALEAITQVFTVEDLDLG
jgi:phosphocarrier protein HPr